ncbi:hypothetical protein TYRP_022970 [Tyrophagus putrescentiae]|nr:hypothetical protein TYRP_022970 [Tyrophagus putrescentiae]
MKFFQLFSWILVALVASLVSVEAICGRDGAPCKADSDCCTKLCDVKAKTPSCIVKKSTVQSISKRAISKANNSSKSKKMKKKSAASSMNSKKSASGLEKKKKSAAEVEKKKKTSASVPEKKNKKSAASSKPKPKSADVNGALTNFAHNLYEKIKPFFEQSPDGEKKDDAEGEKKKKKTCGNNDKPHNRKSRVSTVSKKHGSHDKKEHHPHGKHSGGHKGFFEIEVTSDHMKQQPPSGKHTFPSLPLMKPTAEHSHHGQSKCSSMKSAKKASHKKVSAHLQKKSKPAAANKKSAEMSKKSQKKKSEKLCRW